MEISRERGNRTDAVAGPIDDRGIALDLTEDVRFPAAADARVRRVGLDDLRARLDCVKRRSAAREDPNARGERRRAVAASDDDSGEARH